MSENNIVIINKNGDVVVETKYWNVSEFSEGLALTTIQRGGPLGFINTSGELVIKLPNSIHLGEKFSEGMACLHDRNGGHGIINKAGQMVVPFGKYSDLRYRFSQGLCPAAITKGQDTKWGFIDVHGDFVILPQFKFAHGEGFSEGLAGVGDGQERNGYIDRNSNMVIPPIYFSSWAFTEGLAFVNTGSKALMEGIDKSGRQVIAPLFTRATTFSEGLAHVTYGKDIRFGFVDRTGKIVIKPIFEDANGFSEGLARVTVNDKSGFIDKLGNIVIAAKYSKYGGASRFSSGLCPIRLEG